ncbi:MAG TPA: hypothetical protein VL625_08460 [Patescibacteria group bacterium]|jgi:hypothetical protein|nr:hypothetical protein [Patescibacteria group bacterium]
MSDNEWDSADKASVATGTLIFDDRFFPALRDTDVTLRRGTLVVASGEFNFVARDSGQVLPVIVTAIETGPFKSLSDEVFNRDGKGGREQTLHDMQIFYPDMDESTPVTAISYRLAEPKP